jgi:hypothetical protein
MKKFYLLVLSVVLLSISSFSAPIIKSVSDGYWNQASNWDLNRLPQIGDTIVISAGTVITLNDDQNLNGSAYMKIYGELTFQKNNSTLNLGNNSTVIVYAAGEISGGGSASQKLKLNGVGIFQGNDVPVFGPQMASTSSYSFSSLAFSPLPVKFVGFTVTRKSNDALIQWSTSEETGAEMYQVERSADGTNWNTIAYVAANGNGSAVNNYSFTDKNISGKIIYYRVKEVDFSGKAAYTSIRSIKSEAAVSNEIKIAAIQNKVLLQFDQEVKGSLTVRFVSVSGQIADQQIINNPVGQVVLNSKVAGNYIISVSNGQNINTAKQVIL